MPPTSSGNGSPNRPMAAIWSRTTGSSRSSRSIASARGATTSSAKARTILRNSSCSGVSSRSIGTPLWDGTARSGASWATPAMLTAVPLPGVVLQREQGQVVVVAAVGVTVDQLDQLVEGGGQGLGGGRLLEHRAVQELAGGVAGLDQAVGVADQAVAGAQVALALVGLGAEAEGGGHLDQAGAGAQGGGVAGRGEQDAAVGVEPPGQSGHEVLVAALAGDQPIQAVEDAGRPRALAGQAAEGALEHGGQGAGLQALAAGVGQDEGQAALVQLDHVIEVAADLGQAAGRLVADPDPEAGGHGRRGGQDQRLDLLEDLGLGPDPLGPGDGPGAEAGEALGGLEGLGGQLGVALPGEHDGAELLPGPVQQGQPEQAGQP